MTPKDLKTGMVVQTRKEGLYIVLRDACFDDQNVKDILWRDGGFWLDLDGYSDDMMRNPHADDDDFLGEGASEEQLDDEARPFDIVAVIQPGHPAYLQMNRLKDMPDTKLIWTEKDGDLSNMSLSWYLLTRKGRSEE